MREATIKDIPKVNKILNAASVVGGASMGTYAKMDAGDVLRLCIELGVDIVFSGHKHMPWIWKLEDTYFITAGTATTRRLKGRYYPSFYTLEIEEDRVLLKEANVVDKKLRDVLRLDEITITY